MNSMQAEIQIDIDSKIKEAEAYHSMGLLAESIGIFEQILLDSPNLDFDYQKIIDEKIALISEEIAHKEQADTPDISAEDISIIKNALVDDKNIPAILDSASAFRELGLFKDAISEYEKLFQLDFPIKEVVPEIVACLLMIHSPSKAVEKAEKILGKKKLGKKEKAQIKFGLGLEMEKGGHKDLALDLYQAAQKLDSKDVDINNKLNSIISSTYSSSRYDYLIDEKKVTTDQLQQALALSKKMKKSVEFILIEHFKVKKEDINKSLSFFYNHPSRIYDPELPTPVELISNLKKTFLLQDLWVPITWGKEGVEILVDDPTNLNKMDHIRALIKTKKIHFSVGIKEDIEAFIKHFFDGKKPEYIEENTEGSIDDFDLIPDISFEEEEDEDQIEELDEASGQVVKVVDQVLVAAYRKNSSDIHIEPSPLTKATTIRFRLDGVCQEYLQIPNSMAKGILSRLKIMAGLDIAEKRLPQDGKIKFKRKGVPPFDLRLATLPTAGGYEDAVLRILAKAGAMKIDEMGLKERNKAIMKEIVTKPYGLVLVVGPTGSGKTTSLHAALGYINKPGVKIWTAEDPIEITQAGLRQVETKNKIGLNFARIMRSFLRADPDVIMIGEMRDYETASIGIEASLTGHLVFSTLHTNSAPETVTRLLDMGLNPLNFSDAFLGVLAQRLVRRLCPSCREEYHPSEQEFNELAADYGKESFEATGIEFSPALTIYRPGRCDACSSTGYKGRLGIHELMEGTDEIKIMIKKQANTEDISVQARKDGMTTLKQDGIEKVFQGLTDITEIRRVCID
ncbi:MAG: ATPase, T2SS/T4P/T4SS family [Thermodesulfobacteriota bacterium]|nr:ATPase, T2SS/T4P/T4SS family [Thermodesulfobacteriota bacterium]